MNSKNKDYLLNFARRRLKNFSNDLASLTELVKIKNKELSEPLDETEVFLILQKAVNMGAIKPPVSCNSAASLSLDDAEQPTFYIPQILCNGVTFLNAPPKGGKSRMFMQMALALCTGGKFMGRQCKKTGVLYLPLEDEKADFESRLQLFLQGENVPDSLYYATIENFDYLPPRWKTTSLSSLLNTT